MTQKHKEKKPDMRAYIVWAHLNEMPKKGKFIEAEK